MMKNINPNERKVIHAIYACLSKTYSLFLYLRTRKNCDASRGPEKGRGRERERERRRDTERHEMHGIQSASMLN